MTLSRDQRIARYGGRAPRYTSYPTANHFHALGPDAVTAVLPALEPRVSVYAHIPFCTKLCWYCGCNTTIRRDRSVGDVLVDGLLAELELVAEHLDGPRAMAQLALGGGTPNFLEDGSMRRLVGHLTQVFVPDADTVLSTELDPRTVTDGQLDTLADLGFRRFSLGVQSLDPEVQAAVNRPLDPDRLRDIGRILRSLGSTSLNLDLMIGLPLQTPATLDRTLKTVLDVRPERLAVFQYAHMPRLRPAQKLLERHGLPGAAERDVMFRHIRDRLVEAGYVRVGFDHFALPADPLAVATLAGTLERNFQGFTEDTARDLIALGPSAIGRIGRLFYQNHRDTGPWEEALAQRTLPVVRGLESTDEDELLGALIKDLMCRNETRLAPLGERRTLVETRLRPFVRDGLVEIDADRVTVTDAGFDFVRSIAAVFDARLDPEAHATVA